MFKLRIKRPFQKPDFYIETDDTNLYKTLHTMYLPFVTADRTLVQQDYVIKIYKENGQYIMETDTKCPINYQDALQSIENIFYTNASIDDSILALHSAVVAYNNKAYVLIGSTQSGKSTLTAYLYHKGFEYISDDILLLRKQNLSVIPFNRPLQLRDGGFEVLRKNGIKCDNCIWIDWGNIRRAIISPISPKYDEYCLGGIFFINRTDNLNFLNPISKQNAFLKLLKNLYKYSSTNIEIIKILKNLCEMNLFDLSYCDMDFVEKVIKTGDNGGR